MPESHHNIQNINLYNQVNIILSKVYQVLYIPIANIAAMTKLRIILFDF